MKRLKDNLMLIVLCIVIVCCTISVNKKLNEISWKVENLEYNIVLPWINDIYKVLDNIEWTAETTDKRIKNIELMLDWSLDDIVYYLEK